MPEGASRPAKGSAPVPAGLVQAYVPLAHRALIVHLTLLEHCVELLAEGSSLEDMHFTKVAQLSAPGRWLPVASPAARMLWPAAHPVTESARGCRNILSSEMQKTCQFWLSTFWLLTVYLRVFLTLLNDFVHF